jgi:peroxiredoxin
MASGGTDEPGPRMSASARYEAAAMKSARFVVAALTAAVLAVGGYVAWHGAGNAGQVPSVSYTLLDGSRSTTDALRGKVVLINFWATSCTTCVHEMPQIVATHEKFKSRGYDTLAVAMSYDPPAYVINFAESRKLPFGVAIDNTGAIARSFGSVQLTPTSVLVNKRGEIVKRFVGEPDFVALHALVDKLLAET